MAIRILRLLESICVTQMGLALFGHFVPFFNLLFVPLMLMTGGNIIPSPLLAPFYQHIGQFLPSGVPGFMQLIYIGQNLWSFVLHLLPISIMTWGIKGNYRTKDKSRKKCTCTGRFRHDMIRNE